MHHPFPAHRSRDRRLMGLLLGVALGLASCGGASGGSDEGGGDGGGSSGGSAAGALTVIESVPNEFDYTVKSGMTSLTHTVQKGDVIIAVTAGWTNDSTNVFPITVSDNVNSGDYTLINSQFVYPQLAGYFGAVWYKVANASGVPTVTFSTSSGWGSTFGCVISISGWSGTPSVDNGASTSSDDTSGTSTIQGGNVSSGYDNEVLLAAPWNQNFINSVPAGWTQFGGGSTDTCYYAVKATAGANNFAGPLAAASDWLTLFAGLYDAAPN
jgi:hypothetical protein